MSRLGELFQALRSEGRFHSRGTFSIDAQKALSKLSQHQLSDPSRYGTLLVSAAVNSGASFLSIKTSSNRILYRYDGRAPELEALREAMLGNPLGQARPIRDLSLAVLAAHQQGGLWVAVRWPGAQLMSGPKKLEFLEVDGSDGETSVEIREPWGLGLLGRALQRQIGCSVDVDQVVAHCSHAPIAITVNGAKMNRTMHLGTCHWMARLIPDGAGVPDPIPITFTPLRADFPELASPGPWGGVLGIGEASDWGKSVTLVVDGIDFRYPPALVAPGARGLIYAPHLTRDLSAGRLVENTEFQDLVVDLKEMALT